MVTWNARTAREVLDIACREQSLDYADLEMIQFSKSAVFLLDHELVARVSRPGADIERIRSGMRLAHWLDEQGFPIARPLGGPVAVHRSGVSYWQRADVDRDTSPEEWADILSQFHRAAGSYPETLPRWQPLRDLARQLLDLQKGGLLSDQDTETLWSWQRHLESRLADATSDLGYGPIHGNAHRDNARSGQSGPTLFDFDFVCWGPREWDLVAEAVAPRRFGASREQYERFSQTYGYSVAGWPGFADAVLARELLMTVFRIGIDAHLTGGESESQRRMSYWRGDPQPPTWQGF